MSEFYDLLDEYLGDQDDITDIRVVVRRLWFYDFLDNPVRVWQGKGKLFTTGDVEWLGSIDASNTDHHKTPSIQDGRDGSSPVYTTSLTIPDLPGQNPGQLYEELKAEQSLVFGRKLTCYLAIFKQDEFLRVSTPITFFKELNMLSPKFSESLQPDGAGKYTRQYTVTINSKDGNFGRSTVPNRTYADAQQKERARQLGISVDKGSEYLAILANRTFQIP